MLAMNRSEMKMTRQLHDLGQSLWHDNISRDVLSSGTVKHYIDKLSSVPLLLITLGALLTGGMLHAQNLGLEGETGVFVTPLAYTVASPANNVGRPVVSFHFLDHGSVVGTFSNISVTAGAFGRLEFGYTRDVHTTGGSPTLSPLWHNGFNIVHGKVNIVPENTGKQSWIPAVSAGFLVRTQVHNVGGAIANKDSHNGDVYVVASKTITQIKGLPPIIVSGGVRGTNAELWGIAGNAESFQARAFGAAGFQLKGPFKSTLTLASEVAQQPRHPEGLPSALIPTTITYAARVVPIPERKFNIDFGVAQVANHIMPGADLKSRHQFAMGISYAF
jgi:hypothetical protein